MIKRTEAEELALVEALSPAIKPPTTARKTEERESECKYVLWPSVLMVLEWDLEDEYDINMAFDKIYIAARDAGWNDFEVSEAVEALRGRYDRRQHHDARDQNAGVSESENDDSLSSVEVSTAIPSALDARRTHRGIKMDPLFKTDLWTVANAAGGKLVEVQLRAVPESTEAYADRLKSASEYLGLERVNIFYDSSANLYHIGSGSVQVRSLPVHDVKVEIRQFADDDLTSLVDGRDILERANEMLDTIDEGDDLYGEHIFREDDENDSYRF